MPELVLAGNDQQTVPVVISVAEGLGYTASLLEGGQIKLERGSLTKTLLLGGLAGKGFHISFTFAIGADGAGNTLVRFDQDSALGAVKGGAIGFAKSKSAFNEFMGAVRTEATSRSILLAER